MHISAFAPSLLSKQQQFYPLIYQLIYQLLLLPHHDSVGLPAESQVSGQQQQHLSLLYISGCKQAKPCPWPSLSDGNIDL
jgi:hypothetical protein